MERHLETAVAAARAAGEIAMRHFRTDLAVETKPDHSPVTEADRACERRIVEILLSEFPDYGLCGEEQGETPPRPCGRSTSLTRVRGRVGVGGQGTVSVFDSCL